MPAVGTCSRWVLAVFVLVASQRETAGRQPWDMMVFPPILPVVAMAALYVPCGLVAFVCIVTLKRH